MSQSITINGIVMCHLPSVRKAAQKLGYREPVLLSGDTYNVHYTPRSWPSPVRMDLYNEVNEELLKRQHKLTIDEDYKDQLYALQEAYSQEFLRHMIDQNGQYIQGEETLADGSVVWNVALVGG